MPLSLQTMTLLDKFLIEASQLEQRIELLRNLLSSQQSFEPYTLWKQVCNNNFIGIDELKSIDNQSKIQGLLAILIYFDSDFDRALNYDDFYRLIVPNDDTVLRQVVTIRKCGLLQDQQIFHYLSAIISTYSDGFLQLQSIKIQLQQQYDFDIIDCYNSIKPKLVDRFVVRLIGKGSKTLQYQHIYSTLSFEDYIRQYDKIEQSSKQHSKTPEKIMKELESPIKVKQQQIKSPSEQQYWTPVRKIYQHNAINDNSNEIIACVKKRAAIVIHTSTGNQNYYQVPANRAVSAKNTHKK